MKLQKLPHDPGKLIDFFEEGLPALGALCERTWHDRLQVVAEGAAAKLWHADGTLVDAEIHFPPAGDTTPREAGREVFPGCPLTFRLAEALWPQTLVLDRVCIQTFENVKPPTVEVAEKLWSAQRPGTLRWKMEAPMTPGWHFSVLVLARCEIQAIDQHWSLHRLAVSLPDGDLDESLAGSLDFAQAQTEGPQVSDWPVPDLAQWAPLIRRALEADLAADLEPIRTRQQNYLRRELERIDSYFKNYERELQERLERQHQRNTKFTIRERLAAAKAEHERRRHDQVQRHEIRIKPHLDALLLIAEPAWQTRVSFFHKNETHNQPARFVPRSRRWIVLRSG
ncbi:MAG: hypothetical protein HY735_04700 [Verrucomicrobia bacterium]|nr:hypothetical protein [Verrucomicrobiota bacterium]